MHRRPLLIAAASALVVLSALPVLLSGNRLAGFDWDWFFAHHEAVRRAVVEHHQFPWWNPWVAGGAPLYADPQVGVVSLQIPFVLLFGTVLGLKLGYVAHLLVGFWGMYLLLGLGGAPPLRRALLAGAFIASTFVRFHFATGHYTFLQYLLAPFVFFAYLRGLDDRRWRVGAGLAIALVINSSPHHMAIQMLVLLALVGAYQGWRAPDRRRFLVDHLWLGAFVLVLCLPRLVFAFEYLRDFPRTELSQPVIEPGWVARAFLLPSQRMDVGPRGAPPNWELSAYLGAGFVLLVAWLGGRALWRRATEPTVVLLAALAAITLIVGMGPFGRFSPYALLAKVPVLSALQMPPRWFGWTLFLLVLAVGRVKEWPRGATVLLAAAVIELHVANVITPTPFQQPPQPKVASTFDEYDDYPRPPGRGTSMFLAMQHGFGEVRGYEPMLGYQQYTRPTKRCGANRGCKMLSPNARFVRWSPNVIELARTGPGVISLNENPGAYWLINGQRDPHHPRVAEPDWFFHVADPAPRATLVVSPARKPLLLVPLFGLLLLPLLRWTSD